VLVARADEVALLQDVGGVELAGLDEAVRLVVHVLDAVLVGHDVSFHQLVLLHQVLHRGQVLPCSRDNTY